MQLRKSVTFQGTPYFELKFREPTGIAIAECGVPVKSVGNDVEKENKVDSKAVHKLIAYCSDTPIEVIDMLSPADWFEAMSEVMGFFTDTAPATPS